MKQMLTHKDYRTLINACLVCLRPYNRLNYSQTQDINEAYHKLLDLINFGEKPNVVVGNKKVGKRTRVRNP